MKKLSLLIAALFVALSAAQLQAAEADGVDKEKYIPWTWDDIKD